MSGSTAHERLAAAYALDGSNDASEDLYRRWAATYDADLVSEGYFTPHQCALLVRQVVDSATPHVLDVGCGTGLVGRALAAWLPQARTVGADLTPAMVEQARATGAYEEVHAPVDLKRPLPDLGGPFDAVVCGGTFAIGHVLPSALKNLVEVARPGGSITFSVTRQHSLEHDFLGEVDGLVADGAVEKVTEMFNGPLTHEGGGDYWTLRRL